MKAERKNGGDREALREKYAEKIQALRQGQRASMKQLKPIVENNQALITSTMKDIALLREEWKEEKQAIAAKHGVEKSKKGGKRKNKAKDKRKNKAKTKAIEEGTEEMNEEKTKRRKGKKGKGKKAGKGSKGVRTAAKFLLWDGSVKSIADVDENAGKAMEIERN